MSFCYNDDNKKRLQTRLNRIEGQIRGIGRMIEGNRDCMEILNQVTSCQAALKGVWQEVVRGHLQNCIKDALKNERQSTLLIDELIRHLDKIK